MTGQMTSFLACLPRRALPSCVAQFGGLRAGAAGAELSRLRSMDSPLHAACVNGDVGVLSGMLSGVSSRSANDPDTVLGWCPLHFAAQFGRQPIVELLLSPPVRAPAATAGAAAAPPICSRAREQLLLGIAGGLTDRAVSPCWLVFAGVRLRPSSGERGDADRADAPAHGIGQRARRCRSNTPAARRVREPPRQPARLHRATFRRFAGARQPGAAAGAVRCRWCAHPHGPRPSGLQLQLTASQPSNAAAPRHCPACAWR
jgi:hypothetical protein